MDQNIMLWKACGRGKDYGLKGQNSDETYLLTQPLQSPSLAPWVFIMCSISSCSVSLVNPQ